MTRGRAELLAVLERTRTVYVAARVRVVPSAVRQWRAGRHTPSAAARTLLASNYGIEPAAWDEPAGPRR